MQALESGEMRTQTKPLFWEFRHGAAIRDGKWKLVTRTFDRKSPTKHKWELYDVTVDPSEITDLAERNPKVVQRLSQHWQNWYAESYESGTAASSGAKR